jgi:hypothetical protein
MFEIVLGIVLAAFALRLIAAVAGLLVYNEMFRNVVLGVPAILGVLWFLSYHH